MKHGNEQPPRDGASKETAPRQEIDDPFFLLRLSIKDESYLEGIIERSNGIIERLNAINSTQWDSEMSQQLNVIVKEIESLRNAAGDDALLDIGRALKKKNDTLPRTASFLLCARLDSIRSRIGGDEEVSDEERFVPFLLSKGRLGLYTPEGRLLVQKEDVDAVELESVTQELWELDGEMFYYEANKNIVGAPFTENDAQQYQKDTREKENLLEELRSRFLRPLTIEDLTGKTLSAEEAEAELRDYISMVHGDMRGIISFYLAYYPIYERIEDPDFKKPGLDDLSLVEQFNLLTFFKERSIADVEPLKQFAKTYGTDGLRTFLSLEHDRGFGSSIIALGEKLPQESARALFKKYGELLDAAHEAESYVEHAFGKKGNKELVGTISKNLLVKAVKLLKESSQNLDSAPDIKTAEAQIAERLKMIESATELFLSTFKTLATSGESISLAEIRELSFEHINPADLSPDDKATMRSIYAQNYQATPELQHELLANFDIATSGEDPSASDKPLTFYTLRHNNRIVAFCAFTEYEYRKIRFSMMNIDPHYQNNALGQTFLDKTLAMESPFGRIDAACDACSPAARHYIEKGFVGKRSFTYHEIQALDILFLDKAIARTWTPEMVIARAHPDAHADSDGILVVVAQTPHELPFDLLNKGKILSRYFKKDDRYYAVFEDPAPQEPGAIVV